MLPNSIDSVPTEKLVTKARIVQLTQLGYAFDQAERITRILGGYSSLILFVESPGHGVGHSIEKLRSMLRGTAKRAVTVLDEANGTESLNAVLRTDPDVIFMSEIRSAHQAAEMMRGVRSGHVVVSSVSAINAVGTFDRLEGLGVLRQDLTSPGLLLAIVYQHYVPLLCPQCKVPAADLHPKEGGAEQRVLPKLVPFLSLVTGAPSLDGIYFRSEHGCALCGGSGTVGQTLCAEVLERSNAVSHAITLRDRSAILQAWRLQREMAVEDSMAGRTLIEHAVWKMRHGLCSPVDVEQAIGPLELPTCQ